MARAALAHLRSPTSDTIDFRPSTRAFLFQSGVGWFLIGATVITLGVAAVVIVPILAVRFLKYRTSNYSLEGDRLFMRRGVLTRSEEEIELYRVKDIKATYSLVQQIFGTGGIAIISSDATGWGRDKRTHFAISNVRQVRSIREELRTRVDVARKQMGVREYDVA